MAKKYVVKKKNIFILFLIIIFLIIEIINPFKIIARNKLCDVGYSKESSNLILSYGLKKDLIDIPYNDFIDKNINNDDFVIDNINIYTNLHYYEKSNSVKLVNELINKGYSSSSIECILKTGTINIIEEFLGKDKYSDDIINKYLIYDFASLANLDKYIEYKELNICKDEDAVVKINLGLDRETYKDYDDVKEFSITMLVNKNNKLDANFVPNNLVKVNSKYCNEKECMANSEMVNAFIKMADDLNKETGLNILMNGAYRSYSGQEEVYNKYKNLYGQSYVDKNVSLPGFSEHQTGLCTDIKAGSSNIFDGSKESVWLKENAYKYGFILRFEKKKEEITGFKSEPWHYRYVGVEVSSYIKEKGICFEEYYARFLFNK